MLRSVDQYVLKVHGSCNLACDHCYVYEHADQSWRAKPRTMSRTVLERTAERIAEHARLHRRPAVRISLHGGEPLLLGRSRIEAIARTLRDSIGAHSRVALQLQTNGVLLDGNFLALFAELGIQVGISLDGDRQANDRHRRYANGRSSHAGVLRGLALLRLPEFRPLYGGILCTIDLANDPIRVYEALLRESPPRVDFLFPHATWENPPPGHGAFPAPYADWLGRVHTRWLADGRPVPVRLFEALEAASRGEPSGSEAVGLQPVALAVVDTDGSWEQTDSLKTAYPGAPATGMSVFTHSVDALLTHPGFAARNERHAQLCATCLACPVVRTCGGGLYAHRYSRADGFDNPSVYCADLRILATEVPAAARVPAAPAGGRPQVTDHLPDGAFDAFAAGPGTVDGILALRDLQETLTKTLIARVAAEPVGRSALGVAAAVGRDLLIELESRHPAAAAEVFREPFVQAWADRFPQSADDGVRADRHRAYLAAVAAAVAWRAGRVTELPVPVHDGRAHLPGLGAYPATAEGPTAVVPTRPEPPGRAAFLEIRRLAEERLPVAVDDLDPYRTDPYRTDPYRTDPDRNDPGRTSPYRTNPELPVPGRLTAAQWARAQDVLTSAVRELARLLPAQTTTLRAGLRAIVPLPRDGGRTYANRRAFGGVGLSCDASADDPAAALLVGFRHMALAALLDAYAFFGAADGEAVSVPWRPSAVPVRQGLHEVYARVALAELWRARAREERPGGARTAAATFRRHIRLADAAVDALAAGARLEPAGVRFLTGLRTRTDGLAADLRRPARTTHTTRTPRTTRTGDRRRGGAA